MNRIIGICLLSLLDLFVHTFSFFFLVLKPVTVIILSSANYMIYVIVTKVLVFLKVRSR